ncbi:hypothetical protein FSP39_003023 [Pinctada imbricata]|uniref:Trans-1,2-dihydrobenzene-1,2-diol dehydrogenase n=1 Tax=Pinctada imbricata TaxID=66713 RepID=A0AA89C9N1_PINIB|nr:hypothetical protein FSP39_003023 [Pinctada imbricata]
MKIKWGILGAGSISKDFCYAVKALPQDEHEVVAIASSSVDRALDFARKHGIQQSYSYDDMAKDNDIDVVYIGTWHTSHVSLSKQMLNAGKHVLCDKPMCFNVDQVKEVFQVAKENKKFFMEGIWSRTFPVYQKIKEEIKGGNIGDVQLLTATQCVPLGDHPVWRGYPGFGMLFMIGIYPIQLANWIYENKKPTSITAVGSIGKYGVDDDCCIILSYDNGAKASLSFSGKGHSLSPVAVFGTKGCITIPNYLWCPTEATLPSGNITYPLKPEDPSVYTYPNGMGMGYEANEVRRCILEDVVYIGTWHTNHVFLSKLMLNAGKHVLCEKPMCLNVDQVKEVFQVAKENKKLFMEAVWSRAFPIYQIIQDELKSGGVGNVQLVTATFCVPASDHPVWKEYPGFGMLLIIGIYPIQFANWIYGNMKPKSITAVGSLGKNGILHCIPDSFWCPTEVTMPSGKVKNPLEPKDSSVYKYPNSMGLRFEADEVRRCVVQG